MKCLVKGCSNMGNSSTVSFHSMLTRGTKPPETSDVWRKFCGDLPAGTNPVVICSQHFKPSDFRGRNKYGKPILKNGGKEIFYALGESPSFSDVAFSAVPSIRPEDIPEPEYVMIQDDSGELEFQVLNRDLEEEYILSDETPGMELLLDEEDLYVLEDHPMEVFEGIPQDVPPLMTFDGRLLIDSLSPSSGDRETALVKEVLAKESEDPLADIHYVVETQGCSHKDEHETMQRGIQKLETQTKNLIAENDVLASTLRRMRSEVGRVQRTFGSFFTPSQVDRIRGLRKEPWQKRDFQRALELKLLGPKAYNFLRKTYKFPLPSLTLLNTYEEMRQAEVSHVYADTEAVRSMLRNARGQKI